MKKIDRQFLEWMGTVVLSILLAILIKKFLFGTVKVSGTSMSPTLQDRDRLISSRIALNSKGIERGDIIVFKSPYSSHEKFIKRVIGIEGDNIKILNGHVYLNDIRLEESYLDEGVITESFETEWDVGKDEYYVLGDNRFLSSDSRTFGCVPKEDVEGLSIIKIYPFSEFGKKY